MRERTRRLWLMVLALGVSACLGACDDEPGVDSGPDADADADGDLEPDADDDGDGDTDGDADAPAPCEGFDPGSLFFEHAAAGLVPGGARVVHVGVEAPAACDLDVQLASRDPGVATCPALAVIPRGQRVAAVELSGVAAGSTTIDASLIADGGDAPVTLTTELPVEVLAADPSHPCAGEARGAVGPGEALEATGALEGARLELPADEALPGFEAVIGCGEPLVPDGYVALGPAVTVTGDVARFAREVQLELPFVPALLPARAGQAHVEVFYQGPGQPEPRRVPVADRVVRGGPARGALQIATQRLGTFQAAVAAEAGARTRTRHFTYRGLVGVSMGGGGTAAVGFRNPELFDFLAPLGGPSSWLFMLDYMATYHTGGFCPVDPDDPSTLTERACDVPPPRQFLEFTQDFEHWFYADGYSGQGGTFNRADYCKIFRDLTYSFGNPAFFDRADQRYLPPGVPEDFLALSDAEKCANPVALPSFYDAEFNPDGSFPVITFCDGNEAPDDVGRWDPAIAPSTPLDITLAVDLNGNMRRDEGEPVLMQAHEPYDDVGLDGLPSELEPGYDAVTNPDPSDDDWDYVFNPLGTERNRRFDDGEPFSDVGLDGVPGTPQRDDGGYDYGEGNGRFDWNPTVADRYFAHDAYFLILDMDDASLDRLDIFADGGVRDLFNFGPVTQSMMSALASRGRDVRYYNGFGPLLGGAAEEAFTPSAVDYGAIGQYLMLRYGSLDATEEQLVAGDGGHVGTPTQMTNRLLTALFGMSARWPGGDRRRRQQVISGDLAYVDSFTDSYGRTAPYGVVLPPGYFDEDQQDLTYPVVYFLHGYGQRAEDLVATGLIFPAYMVDRTVPEHRRMQKMIFIFPDGRCRSDPDPESDFHGNDGCLKGTFYVDSWRDDGPHMEAALLELMQHVDESFRVRAPEDVEVSY